MYGQPHPVRRLLSRVERYNECVDIALPSFSRDDLDNFLESGNYQFPSSFVDRLWRQSGGNPLFASEYVTLLQRRELVRRSHEKFVLAHEEIDIPIPNTVQAVIEERLDLIGQDLYRLLSYASVQGERFGSRVLAQLLRYDEIDVLDRLNLLERIHQLIIELEESRLIIRVGGEYQFIHALIQQTLYNNLSVAQRRHLHLAIAQLLENLYGTDAHHYSSDLSVHFERGGDLAKAISYYLQAGRNALMIMALDDALVYAEHVQELVRQTPEIDPARIHYIDALIQIAEIRIWKAEYSAALAACDEGEALCELHALVDQRAYLLFWRSRALNRMNRYVEELEPNKRALDILDATPIEKRLQGFLLVGGNVDFLLDNFIMDEQNRRVDMTLAIAEEHHLTDLKIESLLRKSELLLSVSRTTDVMTVSHNALFIAQQALDIVQKHGEGTIVQQIAILRMMAWACRNLKQANEAHTHLEQAMKLANQYGLPRELHMILYSMSNHWRVIAEDWHKSLHLARESMQISEMYQFAPYQGMITRWFLTALGLGMWDEAEQILEKYEKRKSRYHALYGQMYYVRGMVEESITHSQETMKHCHDIVDKHHNHRALIFLGLTLIHMGTHDEGLECINKASACWNERGRPYGIAQCLRGLAQVDRIRCRSRRRNRGQNSDRQLVRGHKMYIDTADHPKILEYVPLYR